MQLSSEAIFLNFGPAFIKENIPINIYLDQK